MRAGLAVTGATLLGGVLLVAAWTKLLDPEAFAEVIRAEGLDAFLPALGVAQAAVGLEVGLGLALVLGVRSRPVLLVATGLVGFFLFLTGRAYVLHLLGRADPAHACGCFGSLVERTPAEAFWQDVGMLVPTLGLAWLAPTRRRPAPVRRLVATAAATVGAVAFTVAAPGLPLDDLATRLAPGKHVGDLCTSAAGKCLRDFLPLLSEGEHVVVLADLDAAEFRRQIPALNTYVADAKGPRLWVVSTADEEAVAMFGFASGASFPVMALPKSLVRPLYRRLPRSFRVVGGRVEQTWQGLPPLRSLSALPPG